MTKSQTIRRVTLLASLALVIGTSRRLQADDIVVDDELGFEMTLPDGFVANSEVVSAFPDAAHGFVRGDLNDDELDILLFIETMNGTIGHEHLKPEGLPAGFPARLSTAKWQGFDVDVFEVPQALDGVRMITYIAQIPLKDSAIQVIFIGPEERQSEISDLLAETLLGLEGDSNWGVSGVSSSGREWSTAYRVFMIVCAIAFVLAVLVVLWLMSKKTEKGTVLLTSMAIWGAGFALSEIEVREVVLLAGVLKLSGFAGGVLGLIELIRKRNPGNETSPSS